VSGDVSISAGGIAAIAPTAVTAPKLSTAARTHVITATVDTVTAGSNVERPIFVAPGNGTIVGISFTDGAGVAANPANYTILSVRKPSAATTVGFVSTDATTLNANAANRQTAGLAATSFSAGDVYTFKKTDAGGGAQITDMLVTIEYTVSE
jgi:hypothetical protein